MTTRTPTPPPLDDDLEALLRRMRLPHIRRTAPEVLATARAQRWEPAEVLRVHLVAEVTGRDRSSTATRLEQQNLPLIMGIVLFSAAAVVLANIVDLVYALLDPRVRLH
jgi:hypothetical protein